MVEDLVQQPQHRKCGLCKSWTLRVYAVPLASGRTVDVGRCLGCDTTECPACMGRTIVADAGECKHCGSSIALTPDDMAEFEIKLEEGTTAEYPIGHPSSVTVRD